MTDQFKMTLLNDNELKQITEDILIQALGNSMQIKIIRRENNPSATKFPTEILYIETQDNRKISLFLKHMDCKRGKYSGKSGTILEIRVYNELFLKNSLPVPRFYGSRWNAKIKKYHLFLEQVKGKMLKHCEVNYWHMAARTLAKFHAYFASSAEALSQSDFLVTFDCDYYKTWAEKALYSTINRSRKLADQLRVSMLDFDEIAELLAKQPLTLVHNDLSSKNVIVDTSVFPVRIVIVDWENPGIGFGLIDLIHLKYNRLSPEEDIRFCAEYFKELSCHGMSQIGGENPTVLLDACELFFTFYRIATCTLWGEPLAHLPKRVEKARRVYTRLNKNL